MEALPMTNTGTIIYVSKMLMNFVSRLIIDSVNNATHAVSQEYFL